MRIPINEIQVGKRLRGLREPAVAELMASISKIGLLTPISVKNFIVKRPGNSDGVAFDLVAGLHRWEACKRLGWAEIEASVIPLSEDEAILWEVDENLCRAELSELERAEHLAKRKEVYERLHPEVAGKGANKGPDGQFVRTDTPSFAEDTAQKTGVTDRDVRRSIRRVEKIDEKVRDRIRDNPEIADSGVELDALASLDSKQQHKAVSLVETGKAGGIRDAKRLIEPKSPISKEGQIRSLREPATCWPDSIAPEGCSGTHSAEAARTAVDGVAGQPEPARSLVPGRTG